MAWNEYFRALRRVKGLRGALSIICIGTLYCFFWGLVSPIFNIRINEITGSLALSGIMFGIWGLVTMIFDIPFGILCDKFGAKKLLRAALAAYIFITLAYVYVNDVLSLLLLRIIHSTFGALYWVSLWTLIRSVPREYEEEEVNLYTVSSSLGGLFAPFLGSLLIMYISWKLPFYLLSSSFLLLILLTRRIPDQKIVVRKDGFKLLSQEMKSFFRRRKTAAGLTLSILATFFTSSIMGSFLPIILNTYGYNIEDIGIVLTISGSLPWVLVPILILPLEEMREKFSLALGFLLNALGFFLFPLSKELSSLLVAVFLVNAGGGAINPTINAIIGKMARDGERGGYSGLTETLKDIGILAGNFSGGFLLQYLGVPIFYFLGFSCLITIPFILFLFK